MNRITHIYFPFFKSIFIGVYKTFFSLVLEPIHEDDDRKVRRGEKNRVAAQRSRKKQTQKADKLHEVSRCLGLSHVRATAGSGPLPLQGGGHEAAPWSSPLRPRARLIPLPPSSPAFRVFPLRCLHWSLTGCISPFSFNFKARKLPFDPNSLSS